MLSGRQGSLSPRDAPNSLTRSLGLFRSVRPGSSHEENIFKNGRSDSAINFRCSENEGGDQATKE
jgi:hypothetical protein